MRIKHLESHLKFYPHKRYTGVGDTAATEQETRKEANRNIDFHLLKKHHVVVGDFENVRTSLNKLTPLQAGWPNVPVEFFAARIANTTMKAENFPI